MSEVVILLATCTIWALIYMLRRVEKQRDELADTLRSFGNKLCTLPPGMCLKIAKDGEEWAVVRYEDLETLGERGGFRLSAPVTALGLVGFTGEGQ